MGTRAVVLVITIIVVIWNYVAWTPKDWPHDQVVAVSSAILAITAVVAVWEVVVSKRNRCDRARSYGWLLAALAILQDSQASTRRRR